LVIGHWSLVIGHWSLVREWGRVGSPGTVRKEWFDSEEEAMVAGEKLSDAKRKKGYQSVLVNILKYAFRLQTNHNEPEH